MHLFKKKQQPMRSVLRHPLQRLSNPFQSGSCQKKSRSLSDRDVCLNWILSFFPDGWGVDKCPTDTKFGVARGSVGCTGT